jgi:serine palmitoyltransferase
MTENGIACVVVGFPATPIVSARVRFCLSASHTREQLDYVLGVVDQLGSQLALRHSNIHNNNFIKSKSL